MGDRFRRALADKMPFFQRKYESQADFWYNYNDRNPDSPMDESPKAKIEESIREIISEYLWEIEAPNHQVPTMVNETVATILKNQETKGFLGMVSLMKRGRYAPY